MNGIKQLFSELAEAADRHQRDMRAIDQMAKIARLGTSDADVGSVLFNDINGRDWNETVRHLDALTDLTTSILQRWRAAARLAYLSQNREH